MEFQQFYWSLDHLDVVVVCCAIARQYMCTTSNTKRGFYLKQFQDSEHLLSEKKSVHKTAAAAAATAAATVVASIYSVAKYCPPKEKFASLLVLYSFSINFFFPSSLQHVSVCVFDLIEP